MRHVIVDTKTRAVLVLGDAPVSLPEGVDCESVEITDDEAAKVGRENATYRLIDSIIEVTPVDDGSAAVAAETLARTDDVTAAQSAIVALTAYRDLTSPTNAQTVAFCKLAARVLVILIRRAL